MPVSRGRSRSQALVCALVLLSSAARGAETRCPVSDRPVLELVLDVEPPDRAIAINLAEHLAVELGRRGIDVCSSSAAPRTPIARVHLRVDHPARGPIRATIEVEDAITNKRVERTLDLTAIPADGRPLAVASSTDELLRASWVELTVNDAPPPAMTPPAAVLGAVAASQGSRPARASTEAPGRIELGAAVDASSLFAHRVALGGAVTLEGWVLPRLAALIAVGADLGLASSVPHGTVSARDLSATVGAAYAVMPRTGRFGVDVEAGGSLLRVSFASTATDGYTAAPATGWSALVRAGARAWIRTGWVRWSASVMGLAITRPSRGVDDGGHDATSVEGVGLELGTGASVSF